MIRLLLLAAFLGLIVWVAYRALGFTPRTRYKCRTCRYCGLLDEDGVVCHLGGRETYKNPVHISNCVDWARKM